MDHRGHTPPLSIAPMMDRTDRHYRVFMRTLTRHTLLYTEMLTARAVLHGDRPTLLGFDEIEHPISLQLGGDDPERMAEAARIGEDYGYDEININVGCPSDRVQHGSFGACLMRTPEIVARVVTAMRAATCVPVTVKHRIGVDDLDQYSDMLRFVRLVAEAGCSRFSVHARKAWLQGLSPKQNRTVPPLRYADVYRLAADLPQLDIEINGGVRSLDEAQAHLEKVRAVMIGRAAYDMPYLFAEADQRIFDRALPTVTREDAARAMKPYIDRWLTDNPAFKPHRITRHMLNLFAGVPGTRAWKRVLTTESRVGATSELVERGLDAAEAARMRSRSSPRPSVSLQTP